MTEASWDPWPTAKTWTLLEASYICCGERPVTDHERRLTKTAHPAHIRAMAQRLVAEVPNKKVRTQFWRTYDWIFQREAVETWAKQNGFQLPWEASAAPRRAGWPWGSYETKLLRDLAAAVDHFWKNYDPGGPKAPPTNEDVEDWLRKERGVPLRTAEVMASILRADDLPPGRRPK